jgi:catechol 2,3-dioxygenase-like lactoylglutathione lyase family enzyme
MKAHISYIAMVSDRPERLAEYYSTYFGLRQLGRSEAGDVSLTDGFYNLTILKRRAELGEDAAESGLHHFGVAIDDIREIEGRLEEFAPNADIRGENGDLHHGEYRLIDPNGLPVSLSTKHFHTAAQPQGFPEIHHVAIKVPNGDDILNFYSNVFGIQEGSASLRSRQQGRPARFAGDGNTAWAILPMHSNDENEGNVEKAGFNHYGFVVPSMEDMLAKLPADGRTSKRPSIRPFAEWRTFDPDGNGIDISAQLGYEVDVDTWVRAPS